MISTNAWTDGTTDGGATEDGDDREKDFKSTLRSTQEVDGGVFSVSQKNGQPPKSNLRGQKFQ
jgi:hypothetical protein